MADSLADLARRSLLPPHNFALRDLLHLGSSCTQIAHCSWLFLGLQQSSVQQYPSLLSSGLLQPPVAKSAILAPHPTFKASSTTRRGRLVELTVMSANVCTLDSGRAKLKCKAAGLRHPNKSAALQKQFLLAGADVVSVQEGRHSTACSFTSNSYHILTAPAAAGAWVGGAPSRRRTGGRNIATPVAGGS